MSVVESECEEMDTTESMDLVMVDVIDDLTEKFKALSIASDFFDTFFSNVGIDENGRSVRRSPRLGSTMGSIFVPSSDGRTLRRRSARKLRK
jgi:hypothetical protein